MQFEAALTPRSRNKNGGFGKIQSRRLIFSSQNL
jgi:hypothetical protein